MESVFGRYRNISILVGVVFLQVLGLAVQVKRNVDDEPTRLLRIWTINAVTPLEKGIVAGQNGVRDLWHNYFYLRGVRQENRDLKAEIQRLRLEQVRLSGDAEQARRLQVLLGFKEQYTSETVAAQVIGSSGSQQSRLVYIDKGWRDGIRPDMPVITADGVVGKVLQVYGKKSVEASTSQVLLINDQTSGVGAILEKSRLQGVLRGTPAGEVVLEKVMADETVQPGEPVLTSGGDRIFPKGLPVGTVTKVSTGSDLFLNIRVRPATNLSKLEEVLVVTKVVERQPSVEQSGSIRAIDILAERLPSVPVKAPEPNAGTSAAGSTAKPNANAGTNVKPQSAANQSTTPSTVPPQSGSGTASKPAAAPTVSGATVPPQRTTPALQPTASQKPTPRPMNATETSSGAPKSAVKPAIDPNMQPAQAKPQTVQPKPQPPKTAPPSQPPAAEEPPH